MEVLLGIVLGDGSCIWSWRFCTDSLTSAPSRKLSLLSAVLTVGTGWSPGRVQKPAVAGLSAGRKLRTGLAD